MERTELRAPQYEIFQRACLPAGSFGVPVDKGIQFRLKRFDTFEMEFDDFKWRDVLGSNFLRDFRQRAVGKEAHGSMRERKHTFEGGRALGEGGNPTDIITVDDVNDSRENSNCARMGQILESGIPRGQEETFSCVQLIATQWA